MLGISQKLSKTKRSRKLCRGFIKFTCISTSVIAGIIVLGPGFYTLTTIAFLGYMASKLIGCLCIPDETVIEYVDSDVVIVENPDE